jgi:uncharacterized protein (DUF302 family)
MEYGYKRTIQNNFEDTEIKLRESLSEQGFGVITEIDVKKTFNDKINRDFKKYKILGACHPQVAFDALSMDEQIGLLLPCNFVIWENKDKSTTVAAIDSRAQLSLSGKEELKHHAEEINVKLIKAVDNI